VTVRTHKGIEDGQNVTTIIHHARKNITKLRSRSASRCHLARTTAALRCLAAACPRNGRARIGRRKGGLTLREVEIVHDFGGNELWHRGHREKCSLPKSRAASSRLRFSCRVPVTPFPEAHRLALRHMPCNAVVAGHSNRLRMLIGMARLPNSVKGSLADVPSAAFCGLVFCAGCVRSRLTGGLPASSREQARLVGSGLRADERRSHGAPRRHCRSADSRCRTASTC